MSNKGNPVHQDLFTIPESDIAVISLMGGCADA